MTERTIRSAMLLGEAAAEKLNTSHVAVVGLGGVGSWCAEALCRAGVGHLTIVDSDEVSLSNCNRQLSALSTTVGMPKTEAMGRRLREIAPDLVLRCLPLRYEASTREVFFEGGYDYIADCIDLVACKLDLIETAQARSIPLISALGTGNKLDAQQLCIADLADTSGCPFARVMRKELRKRGIEHLPVVYSREEARTPLSIGDELPPPGRRSIPGSVVWVPATAGLLMAQHIVTALTGDSI